MRLGLPTGGLPRCQVGSIQQVTYYFHGREVGFADRWFDTMSGGWFHPTVTYYFHGREVGFADRWFATMS